MPRYRLIVEYDGTPFSGWQKQVDQPSVQQTIEDAIAAFTGEQVLVHAAGRTDSGVHAFGQVVHFDLSSEWNPYRIREALNFHLRPAPISVVAADAARDGFEARFSALARHYEYRIFNRRARSVLDEFRVWHVPLPLDAEIMHEAAQLALGDHDFTTFRAADCQAKSPIKTLDQLDVRREGEEIIINASARSFLHHQVRSLVGSLKMVGVGKWTPGDFYAALEARDRQRCGAMAPAAGLYLVKVDYPD